MQFHLDDTIAALASAAGAAARGIIRLSGPEAGNIANSLIEAVEASPETSSRVPTRRVARLRFRSFHTPVDAAIYLWPSARSYTGQPAAEIHLPGSPPLLEAALGELYAHGARPAQPGEFTLRAFLSGRIDLVQAEAVLAVIDADDRPRLQAALSQLAGGISGRIAAMQHDLLNLLADLEAGLDFVEEDIEFVSRRDLLSRIDDARTAASQLLAQASDRMISTGRRRVVLAGLPNAGKSTLFNALVGRDAALVSGSRGTTRDYLSAECDWNGTAIELIDTAGWEAGLEGISGEAQQRRMQQLEQADLVLWCTAADLDDADRARDLQLRNDLSSCDATHRRRIVLVRTKSDVADAIVVQASRLHEAAETVAPQEAAGTAAPQLAAGTATPQSENDEPRGVHVSALQETGLPELTARVVSELAGESSDGQELVGTTVARCRESLAAALAALDRAHAGAADAAGEEVVAIDLHEALDHLGRILGTVYTDDILDRVFSRFCIGK